MTTCSSRACFVTNFENKVDDTSGSKQPIFPPERKSDLLKAVCIRKGLCSLPSFLAKPPLCSSEAPGVNWSLFREECFAIKGFDKYLNLRSFMYASWSSCFTFGDENETKISDRRGLIAHACGQSY